MGGDIQYLNCMGRIVLYGEGAGSVGREREGERGESSSSRGRTGDSDSVGRGGRHSKGNWL